MSKTIAYVTFFVGAVFVAGITVLSAVLLHAAPIVILTLAAAAFVGTLTLAMTSYKFLT